MLSGWPLRRLLVTLLVWAVLGTLGVLVATAIAAPQADARNQKVNTAKGKGAPVGHVHIDQFEFVAKDLDSDPTTDKAEGTFSIRYMNSIGFKDKFIKGKVKCLRVSGSTADFVGKVTKTNLPAEQNQLFVFTVYDSGESEGGGDYFGTLRTDVPACPPPSEYYRGAPVVSGNVTVKDVA
jgi:hypothetical protein